jgi:hypothetical protein
MNVIDHAILISASPAFIWRFLGDISQYPKWQEDCTNISFLTTQHEGKGARWRYSTQKGNDVVIELTAWYDTLGYEYIVVDGASVGENKGRMRLQEITEGTLVQWTFNYEVEGVFSGLRSMSLKRNLSNNIQDSLRNLYKLIQAETGGIPTHEAKAQVQEAPDVEERSSYEPRHPSSIQDDTDDETFSEPDYPSEQPILYNIQSESIPEPPVADDDTKPNPVVQGTEEISVPPEISEPSFLQQIPEPPVADDDTKPNAPITADEIESHSTTIEATDPIVEHIESSTPPNESIPEKATSSQSDISPVPSPDIRDTASLSVFDVFGLAKPSQTQEMRALSESDAEPIPPPLQAEPDVVIESQDSVEDVSVETVPEADDGEVEIEEDSTPIPETALVEEDSISIPEAVTLDSEPVQDVEDQPDIAELTPNSSQSQNIGLRLDLRNKTLQLRHRK